MSKTAIIILAVIIIVIALAVYFFMPKNNNIPATSTASLSNSQSGSTGSDNKGLKIEILKEGTGVAARAGDKVTVNYVGTLENGTKFDSSIDRGQPFKFTLGQNSVIQGWELGVLGMKIGEKRKLTIPPELAYGVAGAGGVIPPNATLTFEVDMLGINQ